MAVETEGLDGDGAAGTSVETLIEAVPEDADAGEAAAIAAALGAHLRDRAVAGSTSEADVVPEPCSRWKLCGRLGGRKPPRTVARGEEWKAAARSRW